MQKLRNQLIYHEGIRLKPYRCTADKLTIGVGRNIEDVGIYEDEAMHMLDNDIHQCIDDLLSLFSGFEQFTQGRRFALIDLRFNLGPNRFRTFKRMIAAIHRKDWDSAAKELIDSRWWDQVQPARRRTLHRQLQTGDV